MSKIQEVVGDLRSIDGVKGAAVLTRDGLVAAADLDAVAAETLAGIASWLVMTAGKILREGSMGGVSRLTIHATHGKAVLVDLAESCLVVMLDQFTDPAAASADIDEAVMRLRRASRLH